MANIFLAARYERYPEMQGYAQDLESDGHQVTSTWITGPREDVEAFDGDRYDAASGFTDGFAPLAALCAQQDLDDLCQANIVVLFTEHPLTPVVRGARHVEVGFAMGMNLAANFMTKVIGIPVQGLMQAGYLPKRLVIVGYRENIYHCLPGIEYYKTWSEAREALVPTPEIAVARPRLVLPGQGEPTPEATKLILAGR